MFKKTLINSLAVLSLVSLSAHAALVMPSAGDQPHFYLQMENQTNQDVSLSFKQTAGNDKITLAPTLADHTLLSAQQKSASYGVTIEPLGSGDQFEIIFTGKEDCDFTVGFFGPGDPTVAISGGGCAGGGYNISGKTLFLYISDIHAKNHS